MPALSLYLHIPYCIHKCSYCDFYSVGVGQQAIPAARYMQRLSEELQTMVTQLELRGRSLQSIFFGGGTPSMIPAALLGTFLDTVAQTFALPTDLEITCEANPETLDRACLRALRAVGVNRLSIGVQSFQPRFLQFLERVHSAERAVQAVRDAFAAGFTNINCDLIFGLPGQTRAELDDDLARALALGTPHLSAYQLTVEPNTPLAVQLLRGAVTPIDDEAALTAWHVVRERLRAAGLAPYEISNFARPGFACVHNAHYWASGEYLGLGAGAVSRVGNRRWRRARQLPRYLAGELAIDEEEVLFPATLRFEYCMLGLRTTAGIAFADFAGRFGLPFTTAYPGVTERWCRDGWAAIHADRLALTESGLALADSLCAELSP
ncbi:MAG: radical SAM family heme chaperone HemW [Deltaproteobacteria bacterium]|nr:radical SAM family heme chaperone HemW [Deltaproteobacteria bacterium]